MKSPYKKKIKDLMANMRVAPHNPDFLKCNVLHGKSVVKTHIEVYDYHCRSFYYHHRYIASTNVGDNHVSTVLLAHTIDDKYPFETLTSVKGKDDDNIYRYKTYQKALVGHYNHVKELIGIKEICELFPHRKIKYDDVQMKFPKKKSSVRWQKKYRKKLSKVEVVGTVLLRGEKAYCSPLVMKNL